MDFKNCWKEKLVRANKSLIKDFLPEQNAVLCCKTWGTPIDKMWFRYDRDGEGVRERRALDDVKASSERSAANGASRQAGRQS